MEYDTVNNEETILSSSFGSLLAAAKTYFASASSAKAAFCQCLALCTAEGEQLICPIAADTVALLNEQARRVAFDLEQSGKPVAKIVCMWESGGLDVPAGAFLKALCEASAENRQAEILLRADETAYAVKTVADVIGPTPDDKPENEYRFGV